MLNRNQSFIAYSLPGTTDHLLGLIGETVLKSNITKTEAHDFVFSPFDQQKEKTFLFNFSSIKRNGLFDAVADQPFNGHSQSKDDYLKVCEKLISDIQESELTKVVLSRSKFVEGAIDNILEYYLTIKSLYKEAFTYLLVHPNIGIWMGATPEVLLRKEKNQDIQSVALAGTQATPLNIDDVHWEAKEVEEQRIIEVFIKQYLEKNNLTYSKSETYTSQAGNVCHIKSDFLIDPKADMEILIEGLHPGPAISGYPKQHAIEYIRKVEKHQREYYCGYLGPVDGNTNYNLFINLRCMKIYNNGIELFIGGGITADSDPLSEWNETEMKSNTLLRTLEKSIL